MWREFCSFVLVVVAAIWLWWSTGPSPVSAGRGPELPPAPDAAPAATERDGGDPLRAGRRPALAPGGAAARELLVLDARSRAPVAGAEIRFVGVTAHDAPEWPDSRWLAEHGEAVRSDQAGRAIIHPHPRSGRVLGRADARSGWASLFSPAGDPVLVVLEPELTLEGRVTDRDGHPIPGVLTELYPVTFRRDGTPATLDSDWLWEISDAAGRLRFEDLRSESAPLDADPLGRPRIEWRIEWLDEIRRGILDWDRPWTVVAPDTAWIGVDVRVPAGEDAARHVPMLCRSDDDPVEWARELPPGLDHRIATRPGCAQRLEFRSTDGAIVERMVVAGPSGSSRIEVVELPWRCVVLRGRLVAPPGRTTRLPRPVHFVSDHGTLEARTDRDGRFEACAWLSPATPTWRVSRAHLDGRPEHAPAVRFEPRGFDPGHHELGDLVVDSRGTREMGLLAEVRVVAPFAAAEDATPRLVRASSADSSFHTGWEVQTRPLGGGRFSFHGPTAGGDFLKIWITTRFGTGSVLARAGDRDVELRLDPQGRVEVEILVPGNGYGDMVTARFEPEGDGSIDGAAGHVGAGRLHASLLVPPGRGVLSVSCGPLLLSTPETIEVAAGSVVRRMGADAVDLRAAFTRTRLDLLDIDGRVSGASARLWAWEVDRSWELASRSQPEGVVDLWVPRSLDVVLVQSYRSAPVLRPVGSAAPVRLRPLRKLLLRLGGVEDVGARAIRWSAAAVDDGLPLSIDDPRREMVGDPLRRTREVSATDVLQVPAWDGSGVVVRVELCAHDDGSGERTPLLESPIRLDTATESHTVVVTRDQFDQAQRRLGG